MSGSSKMRSHKTREELLKPSVLTMAVLWAYVFAYLSVSTPQLLSLVISVLRRKTGAQAAVKRAWTTITRSLPIDRFPACAGLLIAGSTLAPRAIATLWARFLLPPEHKRRNAARLNHDPVLTFLTTFWSAIAVFRLLNFRQSRPLPSAMAQVNSKARSRSLGEHFSALRMRRDSSDSPGSIVLPVVGETTIPPLAGRTMDLTAFGMVHASIVLAAISLHFYHENRNASHQSAFSLLRAARFAAPATFIFSAAVIMWAWFYAPDRLPRGYNTWITSAAQLDPRLLEALRQCRYGNFVYGKETGIGPLLGSMARELELPEDCGNPGKTVPVPCELYHSGSGANCEWHAATRFFQAWKFGMRMYLPINLALLLRRKKSQRFTGRALLEASQSSAFLGTFVALFYYGVCLGRTRLAPRILGADTASRQMMDGGICVGSGCLICGWSIFLEKPGRRPEMAIFVAQRAVATVLPRRYDRQFMWREQLAFSLSAAIVLTAAQTSPDLVQGVFGRFLQQILE